MKSPPSHLDFIRKIRIHSTLSDDEKHEAFIVIRNHILLKGSGRPLTLEEQETMDMDIGDDCPEMWLSLKKDLEGALSSSSQKLYTMLLNNILEIEEEYNALLVSHFNE